MMINFIKAFFISLLGAIVTVAAMAATDDIARLHTFTAGQPIRSSQVSAEFNQLVNTANTKMSRSADNTVTANNTYTGTNTFNGSTTVAGSATVSGAATFSVKDLHTAGLSVSMTGDIGSPVNGDVWYNATSNILKTRINGSTINLGSSVLSGYLSGLTVSNNGTDSNNDFDIAAGVAADDTGASLLRNASSITKRSDATFTAGSANGCMDTGSKPTSGTLHLFAISKAADLSAFDVLCSTSLSPTMPATWDLKRRILSVTTDGSANNTQFYQNGDEVLLKSPALDLNVTDGTTAATRSLLTPSGVRVKAFTNVYISNASGNVGVYISSPDQTDLSPSTSAAPLSSLYVIENTGTREGGGIVEVWTDASRQIRTRSTAATTTLRISTYKWLDNRGR